MNGEHTSFKSPRQNKTASLNIYPKSSELRVFHLDAATKFDIVMRGKVKLGHWMVLGSHKDKGGKRARFEKYSRDYPT